MYDLSIVTDALKTILGDALAAGASNPVWGQQAPNFTISCQHPQDLAHKHLDCDVNLYMFHVAENANLLNAFWSQRAIDNQPPGPAQQPVAFQPVCLDLHYLLTAYAPSSYHYEQQAMSLGMRAFHEHAIVRLATPNPRGGTESEITLTMERPSFDELSRLWQALECPLRMTAQYKASVAMLLGEKLPKDRNPRVKSYTLLSAPAPALEGSAPLLIGAIREVAFVAPDGATERYDQTPASVAPGQEFTLRGVGVEGSDTVALLSLASDGTVSSTLDITGWIVALSHPYPTPPPGGVPLLLRMPTTGALPSPGRYVLQVTGPNGTSNRVPLSVAPWIDPAGGPVLAPGGGVFSVATANVPAAGAQVLLGTVALRNAALAPGTWTMQGSTLTFMAPPGLSGTYQVRLRTADVEADPAVWVIL